MSGHMGPCRLLQLYDGKPHVSKARKQVRAEGMYIFFLTAMGMMAHLIYSCLSFLVSYTLPPPEQSLSLKLRTLQFLLSEPGFCLPQTQCCQALPDNCVPI